MIHTLKLLMMLLLASCSTMPSGPGVLALPGPDKDFTQFQNDDVNCRKFARGQIELSKIKPNSFEEGQQLYNIGYIQCMFGKGHRVPVPENIVFDSLKEWDKPFPPEMEQSSQ